MIMENIDIKKLRMTLLARVCDIQLMAVFIF
jgi:hypothetical protein